MDEEKDGVYSPKSYDITVKYNTNIDTSKVYLGTYDDFIQEKADIGTGIFGEPIPGDRIVTRNAKGQKVLNYYDVNMAIENCHINYTGYLKLKTSNINIKGQILVDDKPLEWIEEDPTTNKGYYEFEGYINNSIVFSDKETRSINFIFEEFITNPYNIGFSENAQNIYQFNSEEGVVPLEWGELLIKDIFVSSTLDWYNPQNNTTNQKMKIWDTDYIPQQLQPSSNAKIWVTDGWTVPQPSGKQVVYFDGYSSFSIPIHKDDLGIQNTIGPFIKEDGSKVTINLTII